ncbi:I78 family peptidase inhibitor [Pseudomonas huaxiensis]|uniref:I78 family peptidase inhibitor n=1 Tax=Pseudomonas huaxiensis TaxID=2213017 RepID=UPI000DA686A2|nr:I78 family peptidase inhibitor [Pseudomonas huaxiensis]
MTNEEVLVALADLIGTPYTPEVKARIIECTARRRVVGPDEVSTKEFDDSRINVMAGGDGLISGFHFA